MPSIAFWILALMIFLGGALNLLLGVFLLLIWKRSRQPARADRQSEEELQRVLSASQVGTWRWEIPTDQVIWSEQVGRLFGLLPGESVGNFQRYLTLLHPEDRAQVAASIQRAITERGHLHVKHRVIWPDGSLHWLVGQGELLLDENERPLRMAGTVLEITEQVEAEEALRSSEARYRVIVESTGDLICRFLPDTTLTFVNEAYCRYFGRSRGELIGQPFLRLVPESEHNNIRAYLQDLLTDKKTVSYEHQVVTPSGDLRWQQWTDQPIIDADGKIRELQSIGRDTTERRVAENTLQESLCEKEVLLREIHHRVKNNLQIVSSLLKLQAGYLDDSQAQAIFADSHSRINSMALIHERLYRSGDLSRIDFAAYTAELVVHLFRSHGAASQAIVYQIDIPDLKLHVDSAIPCGLIINELVTNALKHAFPCQRPGRVEISLGCEETQHYRLMVRDDGVGLPPGLDIGTSESLGLQLVHTLTAQLEGHLELLPGPGTNVCITFPSNRE